MEISCAAIARICERLSAALEQPMEEAIQEARLQPVAYADETGAPTGNADGRNPDGRRGWQWVMVTPVVTVFLQGLSRSAAAAVKSARSYWICNSSCLPTGTTGRRGRSHGPSCRRTADRSASSSRPHCSES